MFPKHENKCLDFSPNGKLMALATKQDDYSAIGIYDISHGGWDCMHQFNPDALVNVDDFKFSRDGKHLIAWDDQLRCTMTVYRLLMSQEGTVSGVSEIAKFNPSSDTSLGLRHVELSPDRQYIFSGSYDSKLRLYNSLSWRELFTFDHTW